MGGPFIKTGHTCLMSICWCHFERCHHDFMPNFSIWVPFVVKWLETVPTQSCLASQHLGFESYCWKSAKVGVWLNRLCQLNRGRICPSVPWWLAMSCHNAPSYDVTRQKGRSRYFAEFLFYAASHALCSQEGSTLCFCDLCLHLGQLDQLPGLGVDMAKSRWKVARKTKVPRKRTLISGSGPWVASLAPLLET